MAYITSEEQKKNKGCIFCLKPKQKGDAKNLILLRGREAFVIMNLYPYNNGHLMVAPYRHIGDLGKLSDSELLEMMNLARRCQRAMAATMRPDGFNLGFNLGRTAGAGIADHVHLHLVPRWNGDTNFMPVLAGTKVVSEGLAQTYRKLKSVL
jgi:ATP adenylyltransferase